MDALVTQQAAVIAYAADFKALMWLAVVSLPMIFFLGSSRGKRSSEVGRPGDGGSVPHAMD